jgi:aminomuconate-semialdehyde/2-hydroxymuconate-6-semialdehyde dehydrogenase
MNLPHFEVTHYIDGEFVNSPNQFEKLYPATNEPVATVAEGKEAEAAAAVEAAVQAFKTWGKMSPNERRPYLKRFAEGIRKHADELAEVETYDVGRPISENNSGYLGRIANNIDFFADFATMQGSEAYPMDNGYINYVLRQPVGVAVLITPWNIPMLLETWKIGPCLAFGNTAVLKPAETTPIGGWKLAQIAHEAGMPKGVFNVVQGFGPDSAGEYLTKHPDVSLISFTGETSTGKAILKASGETNMARVSFELGGKGPNIIFNDVDMERALYVSKKAAFTNQGEVCLSGSRVLVQRGIYNEFLERFADKLTNETILGDPMNPKTTMGALNSQEHFERVMGYLKKGEIEGKIMIGGDQPDLPAPFSNGNFLKPTIIIDAPHNCTVNQEEIFGPVVTVVPFDEEEEAVALANDVKYGLSAVLQTTNAGRAVRVAGQIDAGTVWINDWFVRDLRVPFGGMKASGIGREGGQYSMEFYTEMKTVCLANV